MCCVLLALSEAPVMNAPAVAKAVDLAAQLRCQSGQLCNGWPDIISDIISDLVAYNG